ncbi:hypothetical protein [Methylobacterium nigriterrae]|uniref:hypothetical protein n=1 Tax=Methylobacterium nigriterrae TaxID=3127512 RepID=UPI003014034E
MSFTVSYSAKGETFTMSHASDQEALAEAMAHLRDGREGVSVKDHSTGQELSADQIRAAWALMQKEERGGETGR